MEWNNLHGKDRQPTFWEIEDFIGGEGQRLWRELFSYTEESYGAKPKMTYSCCSGKPGWNIKFRKSGNSFGTLYPEKNGFSVFIVIAYKLHEDVMGVYELLSEEMRQRYDSAGDYMKLGRWMMFRVESEGDLRDYKLLMSVKMQPKAVAK